MGCRGDATHQKPNQLISNAVFERTIVAGSDLRMFASNRYIKKQLLNI